MRYTFSTSSIVLFFICVFSLAAGWHFYVTSEEKTSLAVDQVHLEALSVAPQKPALPFGEGASEGKALLPDEEQKILVPEALSGGGSKSETLVPLLLPDTPATPVAELPETGTDKSADASKASTSVLGESTSSEAKERVVTGVVEKGDTAGELLAPYVSGDSFQAMLSASRKAHPLTNIKVGQPYTLVRSPENGAIELFEYEIDRNKKLVVNRQDDRFTAHVEPIAYDYKLTLVSGTITSSLFQAIASAGENPNLAVSLAEIFSSEINFIRDLRVGDSFTMLLEKRYRDGEFKNYGRVLAARFINQDSTYEGFRFPAETGFERYFNVKGESLQKTLLKAPLSFTRVTSGYSMNRKHPVYFDRRPHQGVDYGAPTGTPVKAVGDGIVTKAGWGSGFGNMVILKHGSSLESMYSHLSGFAKGIKSGSRVRQGQVIAYVGSTGIATGPHLDFRLKQNGQYVNPTKVVNPRTGPIPRKSMKKFTEQVTFVRSFMDGKRDLDLYKPGQLHLR